MPFQCSLRPDSGVRRIRRNSTTEPVIFKRFDTVGAREQREVVSLIHRDAYAERAARAGLPPDTPAGPTHPWTSGAHRQQRGVKAGPQLVHNQ